MAEEVEEKKSGGGSKVLIIVLIVMVFIMMIGMGGLAYLFLTKTDGAHKDEAAAEAGAQHGAAAPADHGEAPAEHGAAKQYSPNFKQFEPPAPDSPPLYFSMEPFVVNFKGEGQAKYLAVTLKFMSHYPELTSEHGEMEHMRPILRNDITSLLRIQRFSELNADDGPDILRARILEKTRAILEHHSIYPDLLEDVYFERFVMQ